MRILEKLNFKIFRGSMPPDHPRLLALSALDLILAGQTLNCFRRARLSMPFPTTDKKMAPFAKSLPTCIKDMNHALTILKQFSFPGNNKFLFTIDIASLSTVIPNNEGLVAYELKHFFDQRTVREPSTDTLLHLAELVLTLLNCLTFSRRNL